MCDFVMSMEVAMAAKVDVLHRKRGVGTYGVENWGRGGEGELSRSEG